MTEFAVRRVVTVMYEWHVEADSREDVMVSMQGMTPDVEVEIDDRTTVNERRVRERV